MRVLLTETAMRQYGARIGAVDPTVEVIVMRQDGSLTSRGGVLPSVEDACIEAAWASADLFVDSGPKREFLGLVQASPTLRWMQAPAAGTNHPMYPALLGRGVRVTNAHVGGIAIAEYVIRAALDHFQDAPAWRAAQEQKIWRRRRWREIYRTTWLIIGLGSIGSEVAKRALAFDTHLIGVRRHPTGTESVHELIRPDRLLEVVARADVVVVAAPATQQTKQMINGRFLESMREGSLLINVARGSLVDEEALIDALDRGRPDGAVLDVASAEPLPADSPLWNHPKVSITPHNAALGDGGGRRAADLFLSNLQRFIADEPLDNELTLDEVVQ